MALMGLAGRRSSVSVCPADVVVIVDYSLRY